MLLRSRSALAASCALCVMIITLARSPAVASELDLAANLVTIERIAKSDKAFGGAWVDEFQTIHVGFSGPSHTSDIIARAISSRTKLRIHVVRFSLATLQNLEKRISSERTLLRSMGVEIAILAVRPNLNRVGVWLVTADDTARSSVCETLAGHYRCGSLLPSLWR